MGDVEIINGYEEWHVADSGDPGWCNNPTKAAIVGHIIDCTEEYSEGLFEGCLAIVTGICYTPCQGGWHACAICIVFSGAACVYPDGHCTFVESCIVSDDPEDATPMWEFDVVDWAGDLGDDCVGE